MKIPQSIFRAYDIRGIVDEQLTPEVVFTLGRAIGSEATERGARSIIAGRDGRLSGPVLFPALKEGLLSTGLDVIDIGLVPTPLMYFATHTLETEFGVVLTGSHNPINYNGIKMIMEGQSLSQEEIQDIYQRITNKRFIEGKGENKSVDITQEYIDTVCNKITLSKSLNIVIDCGNGVTGHVAPKLFTQLGCQVQKLFTDIDGHFPNHHPDPSREKNLQHLIEKVKATNADLGLAFDGDGDRLGVVTRKGKPIWPDRQMMLYSRDILSRNKHGTIIFDVKCTKHLGEEIEKAGGHPIMWKTGHSFIKAKLKETGALLGGEMSGHIFFKERWFGFDDGMYTGARLLEILANDTRSPTEVFNTLPDSINTEELKITVSEEQKFTFMDQLTQQAKFDGANIITIDGLRVEYKDGWGLIRPSNTTPCLIMRFEAQTEEALLRIQADFKQAILKIDNQLSLPI